ncbi:MAG TPA: FecR domain-containing protein [Kofleriaceae bacterium]|nr:FecR domain-containing protein [Kofleriaceae bacterium]
MKRITVDPPPPTDTRRDRVERQLFTELQRMRVAERADAAIPPARVRGWLVAAAFASAAAFAVALFAHSTDVQIAEREVASQITTPIGGTSQFTVGDAVMVAGGDTSVEVKHGDDGGITLVLARGSVDCDVAPRNGRPPFHVIAGEIAVEVVGTRFTVTRTPAARVDVTRGKVRVTAPGGSWLVGAGESWSPPTESKATPAATSDPIAIAPSPVSPAAAPAVIAPAPAPVATIHRVSQQTAFLAAGRLEATDPARAAKQFRTIANGHDAWAPPALYSLVELHASSDRDAALADCAEYLTRFSHEAQVEDVTWLRVEILRAAGRRDEARSAAADYLRQFAHGSYAGLAERIATPP